MKTKWLLIGGGILGFGTLFAKSASLATDLKNGLDVSLSKFKFKDVVGVFQGKPRVRFYISIDVFNPIDKEIPITLQQVKPIVNGQPVASFLDGNRKFTLVPNGITKVNNLLFEVPVNTANLNTIQSLQNPQVQVKLTAFGVPLDFIKNIDA